MVDVMVPGLPVFSSHEHAYGHPEVRREGIQRGLLQGAYHASSVLQFPAGQCTSSGALERGTQVGVGHVEADDVPARWQLRLHAPANSLSAHALLANIKS